MSDESQALIPADVRMVEFYGDQITGAVIRSGNMSEIYVPVRPICENLGLSWAGQRERMMRDEVLAEAVRFVRVTRTNSTGGNPNVLALPLKFLPGWLFGISVERVKDGQQTSKRILQVARVIEVVFVVAVLILLIASVLLIANTIRLSIFARRREIEVMKLVGATNWFVRGPFMVEGLLCGLMGAFAAVVLLFLGKEIALPAILGHIDTTSSNDVRALGFTLTALILLAVGLVVGAVGSTFTLRRYLKV